MSMRSGAAAGLQQGEEIMRHILSVAAGLIAAMVFAGSSRNLKP